MSFLVPESASNTRRRAWSFVVGLIAPIVAGSYLWSSYTQQFVLSNEPDVSRDTGGVRVESSFSNRDLAPDDAAVLSVMIVNRSSQTLGHPWIAIEAPGLSLDHSLPPMHDVGPGDRLTESVNVRAKAAKGQFRSRVTVGWIVGQQPVVVLLAPPTVLIRGVFARWAWIPAAIQAISKDLALPIIVVLLAALFKRGDDEEKAEREVAEKKAEENLVERQRKDDRLRDTWSLLLQKHHGNAELYYLPLLTAVAEFGRHYGEFDKKSTESFYFFILMFWRMRRLHVRIGGLYFKNRDGEQVLADIWNLVVFQTDAAFDDRAARDAAIETLAATSSESGPATFDVFQSTLASKSPYPKLRAAFAAWHANTAVAAPVYGPLPKRSQLALSEINTLLRFFYTLTKFEANRPYEYWYGSKPPFPRAEVESFIEEPVFMESKLAEFRIHLRSYLNAIQDEYGIDPVAC